jgi:hypothetical protein
VEAGAENVLVTAWSLEEALSIEAAQKTGAKRDGIAASF